MCAAFGGMSALVVGKKRMRASKGSEIATLHGAAIDSLLLVTFASAIFALKNPNSNR